ncbi:ABC transporter permease [Streptococcus acidominimus]|uniref:Transport permease protein n=1 Tax=Streptococcus acidominimus TaxID=1326 RepID=A0A1Q8ECX2_STRAI|nr:ABC transporter permease [Streptococcus acidominimus]MBF0847926.1 ABC transporter permease [Streptococcus danieliae]MBF0819234.1 ABC transporter permease [Streptococcus acidominimus]MBF0839470.1 ABC transporter permease [Streptococcus acidominimus]OLF49649.1 ABC transporter [Streptococcus acidominimus]TFU30160.1 ABC transporter permease [Streptococcus acidominimus]
MKALLGIEYLLTRRNLASFIMGIGMPVLFFLLFSAMFDTSYGDVAALTKNYLLTMTAFSMSSFGLFSFPMILEEDVKSRWFLQIQHSPLPLYQYYIVKILRVFISFIISIVINFAVGALFRDVDMTAEQWLVSALLLLVTSMVYLALGLAFTLLHNQQTMTVVANVLYFVLAIFGGSWMPYDSLPDWMQVMAHFTPSYYANQLVLVYVNEKVLQFQSLLMVFLYTIIVAGLALVLKKKQEVR